MDQEAHISRLKQEIEKKLDWGSVDQWHSSMFDELSKRIFEVTQVMLSATTLKRFWGVVKHDSAPSITTLDTLAQFAGRENWRDFKLAKEHATKKRRAPRKSLYVTLGFILAIVTIGLIGNREPVVIINASEFTFSSRVLSKEYPNSVVFDFDIPPNIKTDSLQIQQYWDPTKIISIRNDQSQATGIYYFPGYFRAKLLVDGLEVQSHDLFLKSEGWLGLIEYSPIPKYFTPELSDQGLAFPDDIFQEVSKLESPVVCSFHFIDDLGQISGDNFSFSTTVQNEYDDRWAVCQAMTIYFIGTKGAMIVPLSKIGCSSDLNLMLNDVYLRGKKHDLSALSGHFSNAVEINIEVSEKVMTVTLDGIEVYQNEYYEPMGDLVGVRFKFKGLAKVESLELRNQKGEIVL